MPVTTKTIIKIVISQLFILSIAACSSIPVPWGGDSAENTSAEVVTEEIPEMTSTEVTVVDDNADDNVTSGEQSAILDLPANYYAVQVFAANHVAPVEEFKTQHSLDTLQIVKTNVAGQIYFVLLDIQANRNSAKAAARDLQSKIGEKPWIRSLAGVQKVVVN